MRKAKIVDLMNREIDGVATHKERTRLKRLMDADAEMARYHADLRRMDEAFSASVPVEPPAALKQAIMRQVEIASKGTGASSRTWIINAARTLFLDRRGLVFAAGMIAGILLLVSAEVVVKRSTAGEGDLVGTLAYPMGISSPGGVHRVELSGNGLEGTLSLSSRRNLASLDLSLRHGGALRTLISYDPAGLAFEGIQPRDGSVASVHVESGLVEFGASSPSGFAAAFRTISRVNQPLRIRILDQRSAVLFDQSVPISSE